MKPEEMDYSSLMALSVPDRLEWVLGACGVDISKPLAAERVRVLACLCGASFSYTRYCLYNLRRRKGVRAR